MQSHGDAAGGAAVLAATAGALAPGAEKDTEGKKSADLATHAANMVAEMALTGKVPWGSAGRAFAELHAQWGGSGDSLRSEALVMSQAGALETALELFEASARLKPGDEYTHSQVRTADLSRAPLYPPTPSLFQPPPVPPKAGGLRLRRAARITLQAFDLA